MNPRPPVTIDSADLSSLWADTFARTVVVTIPGNEERLQRLIDTLPFDPGLLQIDYYPSGHDCLTGQPEDNHHIIVGNRHKKIIDDARRRNLENVFVFEDDAEFTAGQEETLRRVLRWVRHHPREWDVFYLGYDAPLLSRCSYLTRHIVRPSRPLLAHAVGYNRNVFDTILSIDFKRDHRQALFRVMEHVFSPDARAEPYYKEGVGSLDSWLSYSSLRRLASHPILVVQTALPPGTERAWTRKTGRPYDYHQTPTTLARIALVVHYAASALAAAGLAYLTATVLRMVRR